MKSSFFKTFLPLLGAFVVIFALFIFTGKSSPVYAGCWMEGETEQCSDVPTDVEDPCHPQDHPDGCGGTNPYNNAACWGIWDTPTTVTAGSTFTSTIHMYNNGLERDWAANSTYRLGAVSDDNTWGITRVNTSIVVSPGTYGVYNFTGNAPSTPGTYSFNWRMVQDGVEWFGDACSSNITVVSQSPTPSISGNVCAPAGGTYVGNDLNINWSDPSPGPAVTYVDLTDANSVFGGWTWWVNKEITGGATSTSALTGFDDGSYLEPGKTYYVRTWNGYNHSANSNPLTVSTCSPSVTITGTVAPAGDATPCAGGGTSCRLSGARPNTGIGLVNPMDLTLNGEPADLMQTYYVAFYDKSAGQVSCAVDANNCLSNFINDLKGKLGSGSVNGFLLKYNVGEGAYWDTGGSTAGKFYVYNSADGGWKNVDQNAVYGVSGLYTIEPRGGSPSTVTWKITLNPTFASKVMYTPFFGVDNSWVHRVSFCNDYDFSAGTCPDQNVNSPSLQWRDIRP